MNRPTMDSSPGSFELQSISVSVSVNDRPIFTPSNSSYNNESRTVSRSEGLLVQNDSEPTNAVSLPPMDGGFDAWAYLAGAWFIELLVWSLPFSYGVFLNYYTEDDKFKNVSSASLALVGSLSSGLLYLSSPIVLLIINRYPWHKRNAMILGLSLCIAGLIGAAFSTTVWQLVITQGILYSMGGTLLYFPMSTYLFEWFSEKKGLANGVIFTGTGVGGVVTPFVVENLLNKYGQKVTFLSIAVAFFIFTVPCLPFLKPRLPVAHVVGPRPISTGFMTYSPFWILFVANLTQGLGSLLPSLYLPTFASDLNLSTSSGTLALSLLNGASVPGLVFMGWLSDFLDVRYSILLSSIGSALAVFLLWGFTQSLAPLLAFSCVYGFLAPSWSALWPRFAATADGNDPRQASTLFGIFVGGKGIGSVLAAPIASGLLHPWYFTNKSHAAYGFRGYGPLIIFTGLTLLVSSLGTAYRILERTPHHIERTRIESVTDM